MATSLFFLAILAMGQASGGPEVKIQHVAGKVFMLEGSGGNIAVSVGDDGLLMVDDQYAPMAPKIRQALQQLRDAPLTFLLNTHHHIDHTGSNPAFGGEAKIVAHDNVRARLARSPNATAEGLPVITFEDSLSIHWNGEEIRMVHFPHGHTDNDSIVIFTESNVVHMGDLLFNASFPSFYPNEGGDIRSYRDNVGRVLELLGPDTQIIPGHGTLATRDDVVAFHDMLVETVALVEKRIAAGMSLDEAKAEGLPESYKRWASTMTSPETWVGKLYSNLTASP